MLHNAVLDGISPIDSMRTSLELKDIEQQNIQLAYDVSSYMEVTKYEQNQLAKLKNYNELEWFIEINRLQKGKSFGELALINNEPRAATVICLESCQFATISRENYDKVLSEIIRREFRAKEKFFGNLPFLKHQSAKQLKKLLNAF